MRVIVAALILSAVIAYDFTDYCNEFKKSYPNQEAWAFRKAIFDANYSMIEDTNKQDLGYTL